MLTHFGLMWIWLLFLTQPLTPSAPPERAPEAATKIEAPAVWREPTGEAIDLSLRTTTPHPNVGETIWVEVHANSIPPREYNFVALYIHYDPEHLVLLDWEPGDTEWANADFIGWGKDIIYTCLDEAGREYVCGAEDCRNPASRCTKTYTDFISTVVRHRYDNRPCPRADDDPTDEFTACFEEPPVARPINQEIDDGEACWSANGDYQTGAAMSPGIVVRFAFQVRQRGVSCIRISEPWMPFPGGNRWGGGPPDYEHSVTKIPSQILYASGPSLLGAVSDVCIDNQKGGR